MDFFNQHFPGLLSANDYKDLTICMAGYYEKAKGHYCKRIAPTDYQIAYCVAGKGTICCSGTRVEIVKGSIFINIPGHAHEYWADETDPWTHYWVHFTGTSAGRYFSAIQCRPEEPGFHVGYNEKLAGLYRELLDSVPLDDPPHQLLALSSLHSILSTVAVLRRMAPGRPGRGRARLDMAKVDGYVNAHLNDATLPDLAQYCAMSVPHMVRLFTVETGYPPMRYVARKRIALACRLLAQDPGKSIKAIACGVGVEDQHYFSRLFKRVTGMTPLQYRQMSVR